MFVALHPELFRMSTKSSDINHIWHPFAVPGDNDLLRVIVSGQGARVTDEDGHELIDAISSWWVNIHGHAHPYIARKVYEQFLKLEHVIFAGYTHQPAAELAERLQTILPGAPRRIFYSDNGSTAVEVALKMGIQFLKMQGKAEVKVLALENAYHGDTFGAMSAGQPGMFNHWFSEHMFKAIHAPVPNTPEKLERFEACCQEAAGGVFIYEPLIQGAGGMLMYSPETMGTMLGIARKHQMLTIADEVMTGFGRTGKMFASDHCTDIPDIMCLSKAITGGVMPLGVTAAREFIFDAFTASGGTVLYHGHSFTANPLSCPAALASLDLFETEKTMERVATLSQWQAEAALQLAGNDKIANIRHQGTILAFDIVSSEQTGYLNSLRQKILTFFPENGILLRPLGNTLYVLPPYCITREDFLHTYYTIGLFFKQ